MGVTFRLSNTTTVSVGHVKGKGQRYETDMASSSGFQPDSASPGTSSFFNFWPGFRFLNLSSPGWTICDFEIVLIFAKIAYSKLAAILINHKNLRCRSQEEGCTYRLLIR